MSLSLPLFYLLLLLFPVQLGKHFFFSFSQIIGLRSDYLAPTMMATDILIVLFVCSVFYPFIKNILLKSGYRRQLMKKLQIITFTQLVVFFLLLIPLFTALFIAVNPAVALYKWMKIIEFFLLGAAIVSIRPKPLSVLFVLSVGAFYTSLIALFQFFLQHSIGGFAWWLGERTFSLGSAGIARVAIGSKMLLRPYSIFPHPNVLGGFLATVIPLLIVVLKAHDHRFHLKFKVWFRFVLIISLLALFLTFSKASWIIAAVGIVFAFWLGESKKFDLIKKFQNQLLLLLVLLFFLSVCTPLFMNRALYAQFDNVAERVDALQAAFSMISYSPIYGVGLNNFIVHLHDFVPASSGLYIFQPVHNIYVLTLVEIGTIGFVLVLYLLAYVYKKSMTSPVIVYIGITQLLLLGLFDHYLFTLQQGQILFTIFVALAFCSKEKGHS